MTKTKYLFSVEVIVAQKTRKESYGILTIIQP